MVAEDAKRKSDGPQADAKRQKGDGDSKGEVMSLEQVLAKRKEENKAPKLKFVSKNDREKNAVKEADKQKAEQKKKDRDCKATLSCQQFSNFNEFQVDFS
ncbi:unnamed protein product [Cladocopium goreaui]|uniref:Uncharacterized protein n=1 Tax=Cladocopium goreaui TaxID=2562237 RepID=A0A9P1GCD7_9DINO|nr:unnamed protein product [Cladocopium goreaui]